MLKVGAQALGVATLAFIATLASVLYQRPFQGVVGNLCDQTLTNPAGYCFAPLPAGGFPFPWLHDFGTVSVPDQLGPEDHFTTWAFVADWVFFAVVILFVFVFVRRLRSRAEKQPT